MRCYVCRLLPKQYRLDGLARVHVFECLLVLGDRIRLYDLVEWKSPGVILCDEVREELDGIVSNVQYILAQSVCYSTSLGLLSPCKQPITDIPVTGKRPMFRVIGLPYPGAIITILLRRPMQSKIASQTLVTAVVSKA